MPRHRATAVSARRGVAKWPLVVVGVVALVILGWIGWTWLGNMLDRRAAAQAGDCREGESVLRVVAAPSISEPLQAAATAWTAQNPVVKDRCYHAEIQALDSATMFTALTQGWDSGKLGPPPTAWLPESSLWINRLRAQNSAMLGSEPDSIATSPVVLALPEQGGDALRTGKPFRWGELTELTSAGDGWSRYGHPDWGRITLGIPDLATNPASAMAVQAVVGGGSAEGRGPVTTDMLATQKAKDTLNQLARNKASDVPNTTAEALTKLGKTTDPKVSNYDAVPVFEIDLYRRNVGKDGAPAPANALFAVAAGGPSPAADFPFVALKGDWINQADIHAGQKFSGFLKETDQQRSLAQQAGVRVPSTTEHPTHAPGVTWTPTAEPLTPADANTSQQLSASWATAGENGQAVSVLVDVSGSMNEDGDGGKRRIEWLRAALRGQVERSVSGALGLWEFSRSLDGKKPYRQLVPTRPVETQRAPMLNAIEGLKPTSATHLYASVLAVYRSALDNYQPNKANRIVVITDGPNDGGISLQQLQAELDKLRTPNKKVPISFIAFGPDPEQDQLAKIANATGGTVSVALKGAEVEPALGQLLSSGG